MRLATAGLATCALVSMAAHVQPDDPTYSRDIAPIIQEQCVACHRPGDVAPFSLDTYEDVRARARLIAEVTRKRYMPPWKPVPGGGGPFQGERRLSDQQIEVIARWASAATPAGDTPEDRGTNQPPLKLRRSAEASAKAEVPRYTMPEPDLVITLPEAYALATDGPDLFRNFVIPIPVDRTRFVAGVEFRINGARTIHHANLRLDPSSSSRELDEDDPLPGYEGPVGVNARYPDGYFLGWTPGQAPTRVAKGMAWRLEPNTDLVLQLHLRKSGKAENVRPSVAFFFTDETPTRVPLALRLGRQDIDIAPGESYVARDSYRLPVDVELHAVHPHAHYRARDVKAYANLPDGTRRPLIHIDDWDFNWQDVYRYVDPVSLPRGTVIVSEFTYDNSSSNPRNPDSPPRRVLFGQNSSDEMGDLWLQVLPANGHDRAILYKDIYPKTLAEDAVGYEMLLRANPNHAGYHSDLALLKTRLGKRDEAVAHLQTATRLKPDFAAAHYNLGTLLATAGRMNEAAAAYRLALHVRPDHAQTHNNLGAVLKALGQLDRAIEHFRRAVSLDPRNGEARTNLEMALAIRKGK